MRHEEWRQKQKTVDALKSGGIFSLMVVALFVFGLLAFKGQCGEIPELGVDPQGPVGWTESCVLVVAAFPDPVMVRDFHLGKWQDYVANLPRGWPMKPDVGTWPQMVPGSCGWAGLCLWLDMRHGEDCDRLRTWPQCVEELVVVGG